MFSYAIPKSRIAEIRIFLFKIKIKLKGWNNVAEIFLVEHFYLHKFTFSASKRKNLQKYLKKFRIPK